MADSSRTAPRIDLSSLRDRSDRSSRLQCIEAIDAACTDTGFFVATGHGLDHELQRVFAAARSFFAQSQEQKERVPRANRYGFVPHRDQALDPARASDNTEFLDLGLGDEVPLPQLEGFEAAVRDYQQVALGVADLILGALAAALGVDREFFAKRMSQPQCKLRFLHYPATSLRADGSLPVLTTPHTDYGAITLLATDGTPGLEVKPVDGEWAAVEAAVGSLVVNLGDMLARWTNDRYRSTPHRVLGSPARDRLSIPFFVNPDPATVVECIPTCVTPDRPCSYEPVTAGAFLAARIDNAAEPYVDPHEGPARFTGT